MTDVTAIYNFVPINDSIASSGQPQREQFQAIKSAGFAVVLILPRQMSKSVERGSVHCSWHVGCAPANQRIRRLPQSLGRVFLRFQALARV